MKFSRRLVLLKKVKLLKLLALENEKNNRKYKKRYWIRQIYQERKQKGEFHLLIQDLKLYDHQLFFQYFRMSPSDLEKLLSWVAPLVVKKETRMRESIKPSERLCVTMRYLVTGDAQVTIASNFRMSPTVVGRIIPETCRAIWDALSDKNYLKPPNSPEEWQHVAQEFYKKWNFPNCLGAIDGKHVVMQAPARSGSAFFNYKKQHSIVLMAVCSALYKFLMVDIGDTGRQSDGSVYGNSNLGYSIENNLLNIPKASKLPQSNRVLPLTFIGDDAFGLKPHMMKPYPLQNLAKEKRVFNYRLSRARRVVENVFGIAASRFRILRRPLISKVDKVVLITKAVVALHNYLMTVSNANDTYNYCPENYVDRGSQNNIIPGEWRKDSESISGIQDLTNCSSNNYSKQAALIRDEFKCYFNNEGAVEWQWDIVNSTGQNKN
ncbi:uncharacterized protein LOC130648602 [Hydractinia symbiolongicarpus]|uniref:uncharacterized protein LOC130648602 n=1 Tax=Hydractinia symbiolongicarpus TaxID=13093 RepID=UPI002551897B|nr:uncharacterized protein LOC130648602 [Hydractinia symbiolongicarpus]